MKMFLVLLFLLPLSAFAYPALGDFVHYEAKYDNAKVLYQRQVTAYDSATDYFEVRTLITFKGRIIKDATNTVPRSFLYDPKKVEHVLKTCVEREGAFTSLLISGKKLTVCEFYHEDSQLTYMIGPVPFGQVRFQEYLGDGEFLDFYLTQFRSP